MADVDYVLGTHDAEIARLGMQHRVWRSRAIDAWQRAGIQQGQTVVDLGAGPGFASLDLAAIVGGSGRVIAVERSERLLSVLTKAACSRNLRQIEPVLADVVTTDLGTEVADGLWCRWVLCFVTDPTAAMNHFAAALNPNGVAVFHGYIDYRTWRLAPRSKRLAWVNRSGSG